MKAEITKETILYREVLMPIIVEASSSSLMAKKTRPVLEFFRARQPRAVRVARTTIKSSSPPFFAVRGMPKKWGVGMLRTP